MNAQRSFMNDAFTEEAFEWIKTDKFRKEMSGICDMSKQASQLDPAEFCRSKKDMDYITRGSDRVGELTAIAERTIAEARNLPPFLVKNENRMKELVKMLRPFGKDYAPTFYKKVLQQLVKTILKKYNLAARDAGTLRPVIAVDDMVVRDQLWSDFRSDLTVEFSQLERNQDYDARKQDIEDLGRGHGRATSKGKGKGKKGKEPPTRATLNHEYGKGARATFTAAALEAERFAAKEAKLHEEHKGKKGMNGIVPNNIKFFFHCPHKACNATKTRPCKYNELVSRIPFYN